MKTCTGLFCLAGALVTSSCSSVGLGYFIQAGRGQLELSNRARPIPDVLKDERTPPRIKRLLAEIPSIKAFGEKQGLKPTSNYTDYVQLDRPAAVYVVSACEQLKFRPREWSFPIVGSFTYLGWFSLDSAKADAQKLRSEGWDVDVRGARAYSTLGWFKDSVLSTMIPEGEEALGELANVVIHESVHATYYIKGQSYFNESIANFVADKLTPVYLTGKLGAGSPELAAFLKSEKEGESRMKRMHEGYSELEKLYSSQRPDSEKLAEKARILAELKKDLGFQRDINNATMIQYRTYEVGGPEFEALFNACGASWERFWRAVRRIDERSFPQKQLEDFSQVVRSVARPGC